VSGRRHHRRRRHDHHHHHQAIMEPDNLLTRSGLSHIQKSLQWSLPFLSALRAVVFIILGNLLRAFCLRFISSFFCSPVFCPKLALNLIPLQSLYFFLIRPSVSCCFSHIFHLCCCYSSSCVCCFNGRIFTSV